MEDHGTLPLFRAVCSISKVQKGTDLKAAAPGPRQIAVETQPPSKDPVNQSSSGGDFMVDVLKTLDFEYCFSNPANTFRSLHESIR